MKKRNIGQELLAAVGEIKNGGGKRYIINGPDDIRLIRLNLDVSQMGLAQLLGVSVRTLQAWEQGKRNPSGAALALLAIASRRPDVVKTVLKPI